MRGGRRGRAIQARKQEHGSGRLQRFAGPQRLPADDPQAGQPLDRVHRPPRRLGDEPADRERWKTTARPSWTSPIRSSRSIWRTFPAIRAFRGRAKPAARRWCACATAAELPHADKNKVYLLRTTGTASHEMWDVTDPAKPSRVTVIVERTARYAQELVGVRYRHCVSGLRQARLARQAHDAGLRLERSQSEPIFIRDFGLPGQEPGSTGPQPIDMHGVMSTGPKGNRVYAGYGTSQERRDRDSRPRQTDSRPQGSHRRESRVSHDRATRFAAGRRARTPPIR